MMPLANPSPSNKMISQEKSSQNSKKINKMLTTLLI
jgi:hypothetical protein